MYGNLKIFSGRRSSTATPTCAPWARPSCPRWALWIFRVVLLVALVAHAVPRSSSAAATSRPAEVRYAPPRTPPAPCAGAASSSLFLVWHLLDLTTLIPQRRARPRRHTPTRTSSPASRYGIPIYMLAMAALGLHLHHGFWSAAQTLGWRAAPPRPALKVLANGLALVLFAGFVLRRSP